MKYLSMLAATAIAASGWTASVEAQSSQKAVPAEFPPASFTGRQYVDSKGCVFIRAGIDANVTWIPRMTRKRQQVCGFQPSLSASARTTVASAPAPAPEPTPTTTTVRTTTTTVAAAPAPVPTAAPKPVYRSAPAPVPAPAAPTPMPTVVAATSPAVPSAPSACSGRSATSQQFLTSRYGNVRCGPQTSPHVTIKNGPPSPDATYYQYGSHNAATTGQVRVAPRHVYESQLASTQGLYVPEGYQVVWDDDRLNPYRAHQTLAGKAQMDQIWNKRVPRTLKPGALAGSHVSYAAGGVPNDVAAPAPEVSRAAPLTSATALSQDSKPASHRYVQIGAFSDPAKAKQTAQRLANSGLPARMGPHSQGGKSYTLVVVGPFSTQSGLDQGFAQVRGLGYASASLKR